MLIFLKVAWCIDKNVTCRLKGFLSGSMSQDILAICHWTVHLRIPSFNLIMCIMRLCGLQNAQQFWAVILTAVSVLSVCLFVFCPYYLFHFSLLNWGSFTILLPLAFSASSWASLVNWEFYNWVFRIQCMIRALLDYLENSTVLGDSLFQKDFLFFKSYRCGEWERKTRLITISKKKWKRWGGRRQRGKNKTSLDSTREIFPGEKLWCQALVIRCFMLLLGEEGTAVPLLLGNYWEARRRTEALAHCCLCFQGERLQG